MELTVQEIIAKVAHQRKQSRKHQQQNFTLQQIHHLTLPNSNLTQKHFKQTQLLQNTHSSTKVPSLKQKTKHFLNYESLKPEIQNSIIMQEKYKSLQVIYRKLKKKAEMQTQIDQTHAEVQKRLLEMIKKNKKLQKELDSIRSKKFSLVQKNQQKDSKCKSRKQFQLFPPHLISLQKKTLPNKLPKQSKLNRESNHLSTLNTQPARNQLNLIEQPKSKGLKNEHKQIQVKQSESENNKDQKVKKIKQFQIETYTWCRGEIQHYKQMIAQKQKSIIKLMTMVEKQEELMRNYEEISDTALLRQKKQCKKDKTLLGEEKEGQRMSRIEGTIVKVKKLKENNELKVNKQSISLNMVGIKCTMNQNQENEISRVMDEKTKKKIEMKTKNRGKEIQKQRDIENFRLGQSVHKVGNNEQIWAQSEQMNETSEFICEM